MYIPYIFSPNIQIFIAEMHIMIKLYICFKNDKSC